MRIRTSTRVWVCRWRCKLSHYVEIRIAKFGFLQNWKFSVALCLAKSNKVLIRELTKNTKIVHFMQNFDILRKVASSGQFPIGKSVDFIVNIWYTYYKYKH